MNINKYKSLLTRNNFIILFFTFLIINYLFFNYRILFRENGYILGDWLVNYNGGFVRRGLLGHILFNFSKLFNVSIIHLIFFFSSIVYISSLFLLYKIIKDKLSNNIVLLFIFLPSTLLFNFFDPLTVGRKEILVFLLFLIYFINLEKNIFILKIIIFFLSIIFLFTHEILLFHLPYFFLLKYISLIKLSKNELNYKNYYLEFSMLLTGIFFISIVYKFSHLYDNILLCSSLAEVGISKNVCYGTINDLKTSSVFHTLWPYFLERNYFFNYTLYVLLTLFPLAYSYFNLINNNISKKVILFSSFCFLFSLIFILRVNDWGRYLNITFLIQLLIFLKFLDLGLNQKKIKINFNKPLIISILIIYIASWNMPHCCNPNLGKGYYNIYERIKSRIYDESSNSTKYKDLPREYLRKFFKID